MNKITDVTRQDILDNIKNGFWVSYDEPVKNGETGKYEDGYMVNMYFSGRLSIVDFLSRIYDLENMPSYDTRYSNAKDDISCHLSWGDYDSDENWPFNDDRLKLSRNNDDKYLLTFICEMLNPVVRIESSPWKEYLTMFNDLLRPDGYELFIQRKISGRDVYNYREIDHVEIQHSSETIYAAMKSLGEGSYARTFKFTDEYYHKEFVLKRAKPDLNKKELERFKREFDEMQALCSPYIIEVYTYDDEKHEYTMELMDCTLREYIDKNNASLSLTTRKNIILQLLRAYKYLHSKSIFHRDVSPNNVLIKIYDDTIVVKISDFGLVKLSDSELTSENSELKGCLNDPALKIIGFANYNLTHEIYAITLLFSYILTGKLNWAKIQEPVKAFMLKGTDSDTDNRYQSIDEIADAVNQCILKMKG